MLYKRYIACYAEIQRCMLGDHMFALASQAVMEEFNDLVT